MSWRAPPLHAAGSRSTIDHVLRVLKGAFGEVGVMCCRASHMSVCMCMRARAPHAACRLLGCQS